jgi:hypothetical protein
MSESLARQIFARTAADGMWTYITAIRDILDDADMLGETDANRQLAAIKPLVASAAKDAERYSKARGFNDAKV